MSSNRFVIWPMRLSLSVVMSSCTGRGLAAMQEMTAIGIC